MGKKQEKCFMCKKIYSTKGDWTRPDNNKLLCSDSCRTDYATWSEEYLENFNRTSPYNKCLLKTFSEDNNEPITHKDNWADRATGMVCGTCMFFREKNTAKVQRANHLIGRCKRHAPTMSGFPVVWSDDDGCGDHKLDETKVIVNDNKV